MRYPIAGSKTTINMAMDIEHLSTGGVEIFDWLSSNDEYTCEINFIIPTSEATAFSELIESTNRGVAISLATLLGGSYDGFHPFGPHVDLSSNDDVYVYNYKDLGKFDTFGEAWRYSVTIVPVNTLSYYSDFLVTCSGGGFNIGSLTNFFLPDLTPNISYNVYGSRFSSSTYMHHNSEDTQKKSVSMAWSSINTEAARNILIELVRNVRSLPITLNAGSIQWPFSLRSGQGDFDVKISSPKISITNTIANKWTVQCEVVDVT